MQINGVYKIHRNYCPLFCSRVSHWRQIFAFTCPDLLDMDFDLLWLVYRLCRMQYETLWAHLVCGKEINSFTLSHGHGKIIFSLVFPTRVWNFGKVIRNCAFVYIPVIGMCRNRELNHINFPMISLFI